MSETKILHLVECKFDAGFNIDGYTGVYSSIDTIMGILEEFYSDPEIGASLAEGLLMGDFDIKEIYE